MADQHCVNFDELNCPACDDQPMMDVVRTDTEEFTDGIVIVCPHCGFHVGASTGREAEAAVRCLWDYLDLEAFDG